MGGWTKVNAAISQIINAKATAKSTSEKQIICVPDIQANSKNIISLSGAILKKEWERVKEGEPAFLKTKKYLKRILIGLSIVLVFYIIAQLFLSPNIPTIKDFIDFK